jgi:hypothetical protein
MLTPIANQPVSCSSLPTSQRPTSPESVQPIRGSQFGQPADYSRLANRRTQPGLKPLMRCLVLRI